MPPRMIQWGRGVFVSSTGWKYLHQKEHRRAGERKIDQQGETVEERIETRKTWENLRARIMKMYREDERRPQ